MLLMAMPLAIRSTRTARGSSRLNPDRRESTRIRKKSGSSLIMLAKYEDHERPRPAAPTTASRRMFPAAMKATKSPSSMRRKEKEPPATGTSTANSV